MAEPFDQLLIAPNSDRLREATLAAACHMGFSLPQTRTLKFLSGWLERVQARPEGMDVFRFTRVGGRDERYFGVAWWSDHHSRRHVRVFGGDTIAGYACHHFSHLDDDPRSPLWHVYPERVFRVERPGQTPRWLVSCACGATGEPAALAWMGPCCGPCHDRREEGDPSLITRPAVLESLSTVYGVSLSPDGNQVAIGMADHRLVLLDLRDGGQRVIVEGDTESYHHPEGRFDFRALAFSPDGALLAAGDPSARVIRLHPLHETARKARLPLPDDDTVTSALEFSPDGRWLAAATDGGYLSVWSSDEPWQQVHREVSGVTAMTFLPDSRALAVGGHGGAVRLLDLPSSMPRGRIVTGATDREDVLFLGATPDGDLLLILTGSPSADDMGVHQQLQRWDLKHNREDGHVHLPAPSHLALSPDGRYLVRVHHDLQHSPATVHFWDVRQGQRAGTLEWDTEDSIYALAFSPDGHTLAAGTYLGRVVLFPWRLLLEV